MPILEIVSPIINITTTIQKKMYQKLGNQLLLTCLYKNELRRLLTNTVDCSAIIVSKITFRVWVYLVEQT